MVIFFEKFLHVESSTYLCTKIKNCTAEKKLDKQMTQKFTRIIRTLGWSISGDFFDTDLCQDTDVDFSCYRKKICVGDRSASDSECAFQVAPSIAWCTHTAIYHNI
jgi:hypothetical protein